METSYYFEQNTTTKLAILMNYRMENLLEEIGNIQFLL